MASIAKTPAGKFRVQWREEGRQRQKNFASHAEARKFAAALELSPQKRRSMISVGDWIANYRDTEAVKKKGSSSEIFRLNRYITRPFASLKLSDIVNACLDDTPGEAVFNRLALPERMLALLNSLDRTVTGHFSQTVAELLTRKDGLVAS